MNFWCWTVWAQILFATSLTFSWSIGTSVENRTAHDDLKNGICQRKYIRNTPQDLEKLRKCRVIEGSLQISLVIANSTDMYTNLHFPELREITGYFLLFMTQNITTMRNMFPNLAVIRGQELVETHALVISHMTEMQEVGLPALTNILRGTVWIVDNANLCYVDTIDWSKIANDTGADGVYKNKPQCPNTCLPTCPTSDFDRRPLCWSKGDCQIVHQRTCPNCKGNPCAPNGGCCHQECLGGCSGPGPHECNVCKHVRFENRCTDRCPDGFYEYLHRRCVSVDQCLSINSVPEEHASKDAGTLLTGKLHTDDNGKKTCVLECPKNTELAPNGTACIRCDGTCKKNCSGRIVESIEAARQLAGCTRITGPLKIYIRRGSSSVAATIVRELKQNLDKIEEIDHYLAITYTYSIYSLDFLENLKTIRGKVLDEDKYALVVKSNENLMELWNSASSSRKVTIENKKARVLFHYNPKLCPNRIWEFVNEAGILRPDDDKIDIGITNGDKVPCNTKKLTLEVTKTSNSTVLIKWENFRRNITLTSHLLNYEIHYKEAPGYPNKTVSKFDDRDPCGDDGWNIQEQPKIKDDEVKGGMAKEPDWEDEKLILYLKPYTYYAIYVKAIVIPEENSLNNNTGAESDITYFRTKADTPSKPRAFKLASSGPNTLKIEWKPPLSPNGVMANFKIFTMALKEDQKVQDQRDFCKSGRSTISAGSQVVASFTETILGAVPTAESAKKDDSDCCSCSTGSRKQGNVEEKFGKALDQSSVFDAILGHVFPNPSASDNEDPSSNEIRKNSRKRRSLEERTSKEEIGEDPVDPIQFPTDAGEASWRPSVDEEGFRFPFTGMGLFKTIEYNASTLIYTFDLEELEHYTMYRVGVQACRQKDGENDTHTCSDLVYDRVQTAMSPTADIIDIKTISINVTDGNKLNLRWAEPTSPNGVVMAYTIIVQRVGSGKEEPSTVRCITRKDFLSKGKNYTFPDLLHPGNYSIRIRVNSLAQDSELTADQYFFIEDLEGSVAGFWAMVILLPILLTILLIGGLAFYYIKNKGLPGSRVTSANPEYMQNVDIPEEWEVPRNKVEMIRELGQGSFGTVWEGILHDFLVGHPKMRCAVKTVADDTPSEEKALFLKEAALMTQLNCYHVVKLLGVVSKTQPTYVIMDLMTNGDLKNFLRSRRPDPLHGNGDPPPTLRQILRIAAEIADGMAYIHTHRLVHRDLAARNCMVAENLSVKVGDFGMTKEVIQTDYYRKQTRGLLPVRWMAPESLRDGVFTSQSDMWSFGVVIWEMATLAYQPYQGLSNSQVLEFVQAGRVMERPENCPDILYDLMCRCWQYDARLRPTFFDVLDRLSPDLDPSFAQVSFFNSPEGIEYRAEVQMRPTQDELITIRTPLRATFDVSDDELDDYDSDDDHRRLNHQIIDDLGDTPSRRLMTSSPATTSVGSNPIIVPTKSLTNGLALTPLTISGSNGSGARNGNSGSSLYPSVSSQQPTSLFSNPPLRTTNYSPMPNTNSNNNYTTGRYPSTTPGGGFANFNSIPNSNANSSTSVTSNKVNELKTISGDSSVANSSNKTPITYTSIIPSSQSSGQINSNSNVVNNANSGTGLDSNESSKSFSVNFPGDGHKVGNGGGSGGGNGYITLRHSPVNENQKNRTTQF